MKSLSPINPEEPGSWSNLTYNILHRTMEKSTKEKQPERVHGKYSYDNWEAIAKELWKLLDDIDTYAYQYKENISGFVRATLKKTKERFHYLETDGYELYPINTKTTELVVVIGIGYMDFKRVSRGSAEIHQMSITGGRVKFYRTDYVVQSLDKGLLPLYMRDYLVKRRVGEEGKVVVEPTMDLVDLELNEDFKCYLNKEREPYRTR